MTSIEENKMLMLSKKVWAVIGATPDPNKFGYKIYQKLKNHGYQVYGINPKYESIGGDSLYNKLSDLPVKPDCVDMVVNPTLSMAALEDIQRAGIEYVWFQPGTFDDEVIQKAQSLGLKLVYHDCVLVALG